MFSIGKEPQIESLTTTALLLLAISQHAGQTVWMEFEKLNDFEAASFIVFGTRHLAVWLMALFSE